MLDTGSDGSVLTSLVINAFSTGAGILVETTDNTIEASSIGTDATGTVAIANLNGVELDSGSSGNTIGGTLSGAGNLVSGNSQNGILAQSSSDNLIEGNLIGTNRSSTGSLANQFEGIKLDSGSSGNTIGGITTTPGTGPGNVISGNDIRRLGHHYLRSGTGGRQRHRHRLDWNHRRPQRHSDRCLCPCILQHDGGTAAGAENLISGNASGGIASGAPGRLIAGNFIGTDITGTQSLPNGGAGVSVAGAGTTIGGTTAGGGKLDLGQQRRGNPLGRWFAVVGNTIGTDITGTIAIGNGLAGVEIYESSDNTIGGTTAAARNLISATPTTALK